MKRIRIEHGHNEVSGILGLQQEAALKALGWDHGFWIVSDDQAGHECLALFGRPKGGEWQVVHVAAEAGELFTKKRTEDAESIARAGSWVYLFGSQYGSKKGPLQPKRHFVARFNEALLKFEGGKPSVTLDLVRRPFLLHRVINDGLRAAGTRTLTTNEELRDAFIASTIERGETKEKSWRALVRPDDQPINIEGATFLPGGHLLLGLRFPVSEGGHPLLVELEGIDRYFDAPDSPPTFVGVIEVANVGSKKAPAGIRELDCVGESIHLVTGDLDSKPEKSRVLAEHPEAGRADNEHWDLPLVDGRPGTQARFVRRFGPDAIVEGIALDDGRVWYAHDKEQIVLDVAEQ